MSLFSKYFGKSAKSGRMIEKAGKRSQRAKSESGKTILRKREEISPEGNGYDSHAMLALEILEKGDWVAKTLPLRRPGDVILDTYVVEDVISGGMGHVYIANHRKWNVKLAIKSPNEMMLQNKANFARILREANSWTELGLHPNIAYCYYVRNIEKVPHIFVEYVDGGNLRQWIEEGRCIDYRTSLDLAIQFCHGMEYAHSKGMIHRDIKPENVLITHDAILKITDFGLVRESDSIPTQDSSAQADSHAQTPSLTFVGDKMGTWGYMSPEQEENPHAVDERADIFSFGICLFEMFCGNRPYDITFGPVQEAPDPRSLSGDEGLPADIGSVLQKCVQWDSTRRFKTFKEIRKKIERIYLDLFGEDSPFARLELMDLACDGFNNQGVSYFDLGRKNDALASWRQALYIKPLHPEATFNLNLVKWRQGTIDHLEVLMHLDNCKNNPTAEKEKLAELKSLIHAESMDFDAACEVLEGFPGKYETLYSGKDLSRVTSCIPVMAGHKDSIAAVVLTGDGRHAVSASWDKTLRMWALESGECLRTFDGHKDGAVCVALTADNNCAVSGSEDKTLKLWSLKSGECLQTLEGHANSVRAVSVAPDSAYAVSGSNDRTLKLWLLTSGKCVRTLKGHTDVVRCVIVTPDSAHAVSGSNDKTVRVWQLETGRCISVLEGHTSMVGSVAITPDGGHILSASNDKTLKLWKLETGKCLHTLTGHTKGVVSVTIAPNCKFAVSGSKDKTIRIWHLESGQCIHTIKGVDTGITSTNMTSEGFVAVSVDGDRILRLWKIPFDASYQSELMLSRAKGYKERKKEESVLHQKITRAKHLYKNKKFDNCLLALYDVWKKTGFSDRRAIAEIYADLKLKARIVGVAFSFQRGVLRGHDDGINCTAITHDGSYALSGSEDTTLRIWKIKAGGKASKLEGHTSAVNAVAASAVGRFAVSGSNDKTLRVWELATERCVRKIKGHVNWVNAVACTPDGKIAVSCGNDKTLRCWVLNTGQCIRVMKGHTQWITSVAVSPDGRFAISGSEDKSLRMWDLETGACIRTMQAHTDVVRSVAITPDMKYAVSAGNDKTIRVWRLDAGQCVNSIEGHLERITAVAISPDGRFTISGSEDRTLKLWELESGKCVHTMEGHTHGIRSVAIAPDGSYAVSGSSDKTLRMWELIWELEFPDPVDWNEGVRPYLEIFLTLRNGKWTGEDFKDLLNELAEKRGYGWVREERIKEELKKMTRAYLQ